MKQNHVNACFTNTSGHGDRHSHHRHVAFGTGSCISCLLSLSRSCRERSGCQGGVSFTSALAQHRVQQRQYVISLGLRSSLAVPFLPASDLDYYTALGSCNSISSSCRMKCCFGMLIYIEINHNHGHGKLLPCFVLVISLYCTY